MIYAAIKLSENTKKALIVFFLLFILLFVLIGYISMAIEGVMKKQGSKADEMLSNVVKAELFDSEKKLRRFGIKKNARVFYHDSVVPFLIILGSVGAYLLYCLFSGKWGYNPFNKVDGFATLFYEFSAWPRETFFGIKLISGWPSVVSKPHFEVAALFSYFFVPIFIAGCLWFLYYVQAYISRSIRIRKISRSIFRKKLVPDEPTSLTND